MKNWEFLLQKEGDRSWLPLDSPDVEILEGRYRIVARSSQPNADIEIRISHIKTDEIPPKRRVQKRSNRTNQDGLMVIIPFTWLEPGLWELHCSPGDLLSDLLGGAKPYTVQLQVLAQEDDDWNPDWAPAFDESEMSPDSQDKAKPTTSATAPTEHEPISPVPTTLQLELPATTSAITESAVPEPTQPEPITEPSPTPVASDSAQTAPTAEPISTQQTLPPEIAQILTASMESFMEVAEQLSNQLVDDVLRDLELETDSLVESASLHQSIPTPNPPIPIPVPTPAVVATTSVTVAQSANEAIVVPQHIAAGVPLVLVLEQELFVAGREDMLTLTGRIEAAPGQQVTTHSDSIENSNASGNAETADPWDSEEETIDLSQAVAQELQLCLRDPQSLQTLSSDRQPLTSSSLPCPFSFSFTLPADTQTHLVLGEVLLCGSLLHQEGNLITLTSQAFTVTLDPKELLGELARLNAVLESEEVEENPHLELPLELPRLIEEIEEPHYPPINLSFVDLEKAPEVSVELPHRYATLAGQPLPPQIYRPDPEQRPRSLKLPVLPIVKPAPVEPPPELHEPKSEQVDLATAEPPSAEAAPGESPATLDEATPSPNLVADQVADTEAIDDQPETESTDIESIDSSEEPTVELESAAAVENLSTTEAALDPSVEEEQFEEQLQGQTQETTDQEITNQETTDLEEEENNSEAVSDRQTAQIDLPSPPLISFQALRLQDRFLTRLNLLATDAELSSLLKSKLAPEPPVESQSVEPQSVEAQPESTAPVTEAAPEAAIGDVAAANPESIQEEVSAWEEATIPESADVQEELTLDQKAVGENETIAPEEVTNNEKIDLPAVVAILEEAAMSAAIATSEVAASQEVTSQEPVQPRRPKVLTEAELTAREVVVSDEPVYRNGRRNGQRTNGTGFITEAPNPLILPEDTPVPTPILEITTGELVAGKPVSVRVKLPDLLPRIYVKLWVTDRETRSLLDGPRWLIDFLPNGFGFLEVTTPVTVPFGSLEIRFEAIAVEMQTQRESHKVMVDRPVVPPDIPVVSLKDFEA